MPSADAENALHRPSGASTRCWEKSTSTPGPDITVAPPANARLQSLSRRAWQAWWIATREEEQAVSIVIAGPSRPRA